MATLVTTEYIDQLLKGSDRLNEMKRQINAVVSIVKGMVKQADIDEFKRGQVVCRFSTPNLGWTVVKGRHDLDIQVTTNGDGDYPSDVYSFSTNAYSCRGGGIASRHVLGLHRDLSAFVAHMIEVFPDLATKLDFFRQLASK